MEWITEGGEIKIDRRVLEEMKDPLIHLVRNCRTMALKGLMNGREKINRPVER